MSVLDTVKRALGVAPPYGSTRSTGLRLRSWRPELPDPRDYMYRLSGLALPSLVKPLGAKTRIHDQGMTSSCTGHAATAMLETRLGLTGDTGQLSRLFPYYLAREMIGEADQDAGAYNRDVIKSMINHGVPAETFWRFNSTNLRRKPSARAYHEAEVMRQNIALKLLVYERVTSLDLLLDAIARGNPVMFGFLAFEHFYDLTAANHMFVIPSAGQAPIGGHAVVADGFDRDAGYVWVQNSWGIRWGNRGYFKMPFEWWLHPGRLVDDMWTLRTVV